MKSHIQLIPTGNMSREDWLSYRTGGIGASEVGAVLGLDDYLSSIELFYRKIGDVPTWDTESMAAFMGKEMEDLVADMWQYWDPGTPDEGVMMQNYRDNNKVRRCRRINAYVKNPAYPWLFASLDRVANKHGGRDEGAVECKTIGGYEADKWESGVPPKYVLQIQQQLICSDFTWAEMPLLQDNRKFFVLPFDVNADLQETIITDTKEFWDKVTTAKRYVAVKYQAAAGFNYRESEQAQAEIDKLAPEPDGTQVYLKYLSEKFNKPAKSERQGKADEFELAQSIQEQTIEIKAHEELKRKLESELKMLMGNDVEVLNFGQRGKVYWAKDSRGVRVFRNKIKA